MSLIEAVREAIAAALSSAMLPDVIYATYTGTGLMTNTGSGEIPMDRVDLPPIYTEGGLTVSCKSGEAGSAGEAVAVTVNAALEVGDTVVVLNHHDRQRFSVLYRL